MLRISYVKKTCPQCDDVYKICKSETQTSVGSPIINCKKCGYYVVYRCCYFEDILYSKIWNDHKRDKCKLYQDIKLGGGSYEHEKMVSFVLTNRIYDVGFAGNVR